MEPRDVRDGDPFFSAYTHTAYIADLPCGRVELRVGRPHPHLDAWLSPRGWTTWGFVTAWNPGSSPLTPDENQERHDALVDAVGARGLPSWPAGGVPDEGDWTPEESLFIAGISREDAVALGRQFGQHAVVWGTLGSEARLLSCAS